MTFLKGNRTLIIGTMISILGLFEQYAREIVPDDFQGLALFSVGVLMILLRLVTTTPVGKKNVD